MDELGVRIDDGNPQGPRSAAQTLRLDGVAHGVGMHPQFPGDGADLPVFGIKKERRICARISGLIIL
jgi:hypothetical protein